MNWNSSPEQLPVTSQVVIDSVQDILKRLSDLQESFRFLQISAISQPDPVNRRYVANTKFLFENETDILYAEDLVIDGLLNDFQVYFPKTSNWIQLDLVDIRLVLTIMRRLVAALSRWENGRQRYFSFLEVRRHPRKQ